MCVIYIYLYIFKAVWKRKYILHLQQFNGWMKEVEQEERRTSSRMKIKLQNWALLSFKANSVVALTTTSYILLYTCISTNINTTTKSSCNTVLIREILYEKEEKNQLLFVCWAHLLLLPGFCCVVLVYFVVVLWQIKSMLNVILFFSFTHSFDQFTSKSFSRSTLLAAQARHS